MLEDLEKQYFSNINFIGTYDYEGKIFENYYLEQYKKKQWKKVKLFIIIQWNS